MRIEILYEDNHVIAVRKPAGLVVQPDNSEAKNLVDEIKKYLKNKHKKPGNVFLGIVHRLDRNVSGIVLFGKTSKGASRLSEQFRNGQVKKIYTALVDGEVKDSGHLIHFLKKDQKRLVSVVEKKEKADYQRTELYYKPILYTDKYSLLSVQLKTGRFHQIRAQLSAVGHPIVGDSKYGSKEKMKDARIALCATEVEFKTATTDEIQNIKIDYPKEWNNYLQKQP